MYRLPSGNHLKMDLKGQKDLAPQVGFEPTTLRLTAECSTVELLRNGLLFHSTNLRGPCQIFAYLAGTAKPNIARYFSGSLHSFMSRPTKKCLVLPSVSVTPLSTSRIS